MRRVADRGQRFERGDANGDARARDGANAVAPVGRDASAERRKSGAAVTEAISARNVPSRDLSSRSATDFR